MLLARLEYLTKIKPGTNIETAAEILYISPSGLKKAILSLEEDFGYKIVNIKQSKIYFTEQGELLIESTKEYFQRLEIIKHIQENLNGAVDLYVQKGTLSMFGAEELVFFHKTYPDVTVNIKYATMDEIFSDFESNVCEVALVYFISNSQPDFKMKHHETDYTFMPCAVKNLCVECHKDLAGLNEISSMQGLKKQKLFFCVNNGGTEDCIRKAGKGLEHMIGIQSPELYFQLLDQKCGYGIGVQKQDKFPQKYKNLMQVQYSKPMNIYFGLLEKEKAQHNELYDKLIKAILFVDQIQ